MPPHLTLTPTRKEREMRYFSLSLSLLALLSLTLGCSNEEGAPFGETGTENPIVEDAGPPPGEPISDASTASDDQIPPELPLVDPDCPSLRLMEFKSAELGPEGGKINLAFTELHLPKGFLNETTKITIARYGMSEKASPYDYYILLPDGLRSKYRKFDISLSTGYKENNIYPADSVWGYVREDDFWRASTQRDNWAGFFIGFFRMFGKVGIRNVSWERSKICPEDDTKKSSSTPSENSVPPGQSRFGKCFKSKYQLSTEGCDVYGAICP